METARTPTGNSLAVGALLREQRAWVVRYSRCRLGAACLLLTSLIAVSSCTPQDASGEELDRLNTRIEALTLAVDGLRADIASLKKTK